MPGGLRARIHAPAGQQGLDLGRKPQGPAVIGVVEGLDAERVPPQEQPLPGLVPDGKGIHAPEPRRHGVAVLLVEVEQDLGVALGLKAIPFSLQPGPDLPVIINLAVEHHPDGLIRGGHGLGPGLAQINDGEAAMRQPHALIPGNPQPRPIRPPGLHGLAHPHKFRRVDGEGRALVGKNSRQTAHSGYRDAKLF